MITTMRHIQSQRTVVFAVTHLKSGKGIEKEAIRSRQVEQLISKVNLTAQEISEKISSEEGGGSPIDVPIVIMGDFNSDIREDASCVKPFITDNNRSQWKSVYDINPPSSSLYTTWKIRGPKTMKRVIDYIFHNGNESTGLECSHLLSIPHENDLETTRLPGLKYPSDHLAIGARFELQLAFIHLSCQCIEDLLQSAGQSPDYGHQNIWTNRGIG